MLPLKSMQDQKWTQGYISLCNFRLKNKKVTFPWQHPWFRNQKVSYWINISKDQNWWHQLIKTASLSQIFILVLRGEILKASKPLEKSFFSKKRNALKSWIVVDQVASLSRQPLYQPSEQHLKLPWRFFGHTRWPASSEGEKKKETPR